MARSSSVERCEGCGFVYEDLAAGDVPEALRSLAAQLGDALSALPAPRVATRPAPGVWSALEYCCHVRDVLLVQRDRVLLALVEDTPSYPRMYREERVALAAYAGEQAGEVRSELTVAANLLAKVFESMPPELLGRSCVYNFPEPAERDVEWLGRHTVHEVSHHLGDVRSVTAALAS